MKALAAVLALFVSLAMVMPASAEPQKIRATGKYVMGDRDTKAEAKKMALMDAKRLALEQAGTYLQSATTVEQFEVSEDEVTAIAAGTMKVTILEESWSMEGESPVISTTIEAVIDADDVAKRARALKEDSELAEDFSQIQDELTALKQELESLKSRQTRDGSTEAGAAIQTARKETLTRMYTQDQLRTATWQLQEGRSQLAVDTLNEAITSDPENAEALLMRAKAHERQKDTNAAMADVQAALTIDPSSAKANAFHGYLLAKAGNHAGAIDAFTNAIHAENTCARCYYGRARSKIALNQFPGAYKDLTAACRLRLAKACEQLKHMEERRQQKTGQRQRQRPRRRQ